MKPSSVLGEAIKEKIKDILFAVHVHGANGDFADMDYGNYPFTPSTNYDKNTWFSGIISPKRKRKKVPVTVCIAAIYNDNSIIGVSDRMITFGDIQFEPPLPKILQLTKSIVALTAGDQNIQIQVYSRALAEVNKRIEGLNEWFQVSEAAKIYSECYYDLKAELAERDILFPYKLTTKTFLQNKDQLATDLIKKISSELEHYEIKNSDGISTIITGIDGTAEAPQPHVFTINDGEISCSDKIGYDAIGIGRYHALSHFMLSKYTRYVNEARALSTIHLAKKKSEVSPGVGKETDMFVIGPQPGSFVPVVPAPNGVNIVKSLDQFYARYEKRMNKLDSGLEVKIAEYLRSLPSPEPQQDQQAAPSPSLPPSASTSPSASGSPSASPSPSPSPSPSKPPPEVSKETKGGKNGLYCKQHGKQKNHWNS